MKKEIFILTKDQQQSYDKCLKSLEQNDCFAFLNSTRTGKSVMLNKVFEEYWNNHNATKILLIMPKSMLNEWENKIKKQLHIPYFNIHKTKNYDFKERGIYLINFATLWPNIDKVAFSTKTQKRYFHMVAVDESHFFKSRKTKRFKCIKKIRAKKRIITTATIIVNKGDDMWSQLHFLSPTHFPSYWNFVSQFLITREIMIGRFNKHTQILDFNQYQYPYLLKIMNSISSNFKLKNVKGYKNEIKETVIHLKPTPNQIKYYNELKTEHEIITPSGKIIDSWNDAPHMTLLTYMNQLAVVSDMWDIENSLTNWILNYLKNNKDKKIIIFTRYRSWIEFFEKKYSHLNLTIIHGKVSMKKRKERLDNFRNKKSFNILVGQTDTLKVGLDLYYVDTVIFIEIPWTKADFTQAKDRITPPITASKELMNKEKNIYILQNDLPICKKIYEMVEKKGKVAYKINSYEDILKLI